MQEAMRHTLVTATVILTTLIIICTATPKAVDAANLAISDFDFTYGGITILHDDFADGNIPTIPPYREVEGSAGMSEYGGNLIMNTDLADWFMCSTPETIFTAGTTGYVQAIFPDAPPQAGYYAGGLEFGNQDTGGAGFGIFRIGDDTFIESAWMGGAVIDKKSISGFTGAGTITLRLNIFDQNTSDGMIEIEPIYWFNSDPTQSLSIIQLPLTTADQDGYTMAFSSAVLPVSSVPVPGALLLFGSGLLGLIGIRNRKQS